MSEPYRYGYGEPYRLEPSPLYARLRSQQPVARIAAPHGEQAWLITQHESVRAVLRDPRFSRAAAVEIRGRLPRSNAIVTPVNPMSALDPPEHSSVRRLMAKAFTQAEVDRLQPRAERIVAELIDDMIAAGPPADLDEVFSRQYPYMLVSEMFGVPWTDYLRFLEWATPVLVPSSHTKEQIAAAEAQLREYVTALAARNLEHSGDDLLASLLAEVRGGDNAAFSEDDLIFLVVGLLMNNSVAVLLTSSMYALLTHPDELSWLRAHMSQLRQAVEELLRYAPLGADVPSGAQGHARVATEDVELDGVTIRAGDIVLPSITSANRDEHVFADADRLDLARAPNPHLAFGYGTHHCTGAALTRMMLSISIAALLTRLPSLRLAVPVEEVPWNLGMPVRGPAKLPVRW